MRSSWPARFLSTLSVLGVLLFARQSFAGPFLPTGGLSYETFSYAYGLLNADIGSSSTFEGCLCRAGAYGPNGEVEVVGGSWLLTLGPLTSVIDSGSGLTARRAYYFDDGGLLSIDLQYIAPGSPEERDGHFTGKLASFLLVTANYGGDAHVAMYDGELDPLLAAALGYPAGHRLSGYSALYSDMFAGAFESSRRAAFYGNTQFEVPAPPALSLLLSASVATMSRRSRARRRRS